MRWRGFQSFLFTGLLLSLLVVMAFALLRWLQLPTGRFIDWLIGIASFWWLLVVVTIPWNIHFQARAVVDDARRSAERGIRVGADQVAYARSWVGRSLAVAIVLHLLSAFALYALAASGVSPVGYISAGAALLLTILRPVVRAYEYLVERLAAIASEVRYPHEDLLTLKADLEQLRQRLLQAEEQLNLESPGSWAAQQTALIAQLRARLDGTRAALDDLRAANQAEHLRLAREAEGAIARISADGQFLNHVREIIRFVKES